MIDFLCGQLVEVRENGLVVQVGGIGYAVFCPDPAFFSPSPPGASPCSTAFKAAFAAMAVSINKVKRTRQ